MNRKSFLKTIATGIGALATGNSDIFKQKPVPAVQDKVEDTEIISIQFSEPVTGFTPDGLVCEGADIYLNPAGDSNALYVINTKTAIARKIGG